MSTRLEMCCNCGNETGKAGRADDSIYVQSYGPLCEKCWDELRAEVIESSAPVESGTVSGEASPRVLAELREIESAVTHFDCECDALSDEDDTCALCRALAGIDSLRKALRAPPLSPVTPSAELIAAADELRKFGTCACGPEMLKRHPDCKGCQVATAYDEARAKVSSTAPATPSVTVEGAHPMSAGLREAFSRWDNQENDYRTKQACADELDRLHRLSLPRALGRENEKGEGA